MTFLVKAGVVSSRLESCTAAKRGIHLQAHPGQHIRVVHRPHFDARVGRIADFQVSDLPDKFIQKRIVDFACNVDAADTVTVLPAVLQTL